MIELHILRVNLSRSFKILSYNISIAPQRAENIVDMILPYDLSIAQPYLYYPTVRLGEI